MTKEDPEALKWDLELCIQRTKENSSMTFITQFFSIRDYFQFLKLSDTQLQSSSVVKDLRIYVSSSLRWNSHVTKKFSCVTAFYSSGPVPHDIVAHKLANPWDWIVIVYLSMRSWNCFLCVSMPFWNIRVWSWTQLITWIREKRREISKADNTKFNLLNSQLKKEKKLTCWTDDSEVKKKTLNNFAIHLNIANVGDLYKNTTVQIQSYSKTNFFS